VTNWNVQSVRIDSLCPADEEELGRFFEDQAADPETVQFFHPHPLTRDYAGQLCNHARPRKDRYWLARHAGRPVGYSMLRGWDEGYAVPSFGACVDASARGVGLGHLLLAHAIGEARAAGAPRVRLSVFRANARAVHLYAKFGFAFEDKNDRELIGWLRLEGRTVA
jgi:ribosomal protein S18 acetylase RimI-like enzyme